MVHLCRCVCVCSTACDHVWLCCLSSSLYFFFLWQATFSVPSPVIYRTPDPVICRTHTPSMRLAVVSWGAVVWQFFFFFLTCLSPSFLLYYFLYIIALSFRIGWVREVLVGRARHGTCARSALRRRDPLCNSLSSQLSLLAPQFPLL